MRVRTIKRQLPTTPGSTCVLVSSKATRSRPRMALSAALLPAAESLPHSSTSGAPRQSSGALRSLLVHTREVKLGKRIAPFGKRQPFAKCDFVFVLCVGGKAGFEIGRGYGAKKNEKSNGEKYAACRTKYSSSIFFQT